MDYSPGHSRSAPAANAVPHSPNTTRKAFGTTARSLLERVRDGVSVPVASALFVAVVASSGGETSLVVNSVGRNYVLQAARLVANPYNQEGHGLALSTQRMINEARDIFRLQTPPMPRYSSKSGGPYSCCSR